MLTVLGIAACSTGGAILGLFAGATIAEREGSGADDFGIGMLMYSMAGAAAGAILGSIVGAALLT